MKYTDDEEVDDESDEGGLVPRCGFDRHDRLSADVELCDKLDPERSRIRSGFGTLS